MQKGDHSIKGFQLSQRSTGLTLDSRITARIEAISNAHNPSVPSFLLACWRILLWQLNAEEEIVIECLFDGRRPAEPHDVPDLLARYIPVRGALKHGLRFNEVMESAAKSLHDASASQEFFLEKMASRDVTDRASTIAFEYEERSGAERDESAKFTDRFKLKLCGYRKVDGLTIEIQYDSSVFSRESIELIQERYVTSIESAVSSEQALIGDLKIIGRSELERLLVEWNATEKNLPAYRGVHEVVAEQAERTPDQVALISGDQRLSYRELNTRANQLAAYLQEFGVRPEVIVGVCLERSIETMIALMGVLKAGGAYLPLDPDYPLERLGHILEDAGVGVILTQKELEAHLPAYWGQIVCLDVEWARISEQSESEPENEVAAENLAYVIYTSGATGKPKGVAIHQRALVARTITLLEAYELTSRDRLLQLVSPSFDAFADGAFTTLASGASLVIEKQVVNYSARDLFDVAERFAITILHIPAAYWHQLVDDLPIGARQVPGQLRLFVTGGESPSAEKLKKWSTLTEHRLGFINAYGPTEATITSTIYVAKTGSNHMRLQTRIPIGRPIANTQVYILDLNRQVAPIGVKGELYIGGVGVARGYWGRAEMSAEKFLPHPFSKEVGMRLYRTGDVARYLEDGNIEFLGRVDEQVKVRGYRVELGEIEAVLNEHPSIRQSVVIVMEDNRGDKRLLGYVVGEKDVTAAELKKHIRKKMPEYMVPETIQILEEMPISANGKIDRKGLSLMLSITGADRQVKQEYVGAKTSVEEILVGIFEEVLKLDYIGIHDDFFDVGGHSLLATRVISRVEVAFEVEIDVETIFEAPTVAKLAEALIAREPKPGQMEKIAWILKKLNNMTEEDAGAELATRKQWAPSERIEGGD